MLSPEAFDAKLISKMDDAECKRITESLRSEIIRTVSQTGGHLASNLGVVELTVALHRVFDLERDRLVFDVGHQCYCHKMLTGRYEQMDTLRMLNGISGFPKPEESGYDAFVAGHASNSVSVALGMARARTVNKEDYSVLALIGDGALTGGLAYEGLSDAGQSGEQIIVILNDNGMSIMKNVGGIAKLLARQRLKPRYLRFKNWYRRTTSHLPGGKRLYRFNHRVKTMIKNSILPCSFFEEMGFTYMGPVDGHDLDQVTRMLQYAKQEKGPVLLHVRTVKGKGYDPAEQTPNAYHGVSQFDPATGEPRKASGRDFSAVFGDKLCAMAREDARICAITAAMLPGTGLTEFGTRFPNRCFDVGIAEGHATAMAGGMAMQGAIPVFAVYSTFLQRGYDMLIHDISLEHLHAVFCVDRAGLVGSDGETHQGVFDLAFLSTVPGMTVLAPASFGELETMLEQAVYKTDGPVAVRYPRGGENNYDENHAAEGTSVVLRAGKDVTLVAYGTMIGEVRSAAQRLVERGIDPEIIKLNQVCPLDGSLILESVKKTGRLVVAEEVARQGCAGVNLLAQAAEAGIPLKQVRLLNLGDGIVRQGTVPQLRSLWGIDAEAVYRQTMEVCGIE